MHQRPWGTNAGQFPLQTKHLVPLKETVVLPSEPPASDARASTAALLQHAIEHAAHYLPAQGPITVFIHHNTLHAFEDLPFNQGVEQGARLFGCQPYLTEDVYRQKLAAGRIREEDLSAALIEEMGEDADKLLGFLGTRFRLRLAMLKYPLRQAPPEELQWFVAETDALTRFRAEMPAHLRERMIAETRRWILRDFRGDTAGEPAGGDDPHDFRIQRLLSGLVRHFGAASIENWSLQTWERFSLQALWHICRSGVHGIPAAAAPPPAAARHRDLLLAATGSDSDLLVHEILTPFCAAFLDQGFSHWPLPQRERGFFAAFAALYGRPSIVADAWLRPLAGELARLAGSGLSPLHSIEESLTLLGVPAAEWERWIIGSVLALRGWAGMIWQMETRGDRVAHPVPAGSLVEFLAVRLVLDRLAVAHVARQSLSYQGPVGELREECLRHTPGHHPPGSDQRAFLIFQLAQVLGWLPANLYRLSKQEWFLLMAEIESFPGVERRRVWHAAFERKYRIETLDAIAIHAAGARPQAASGPVPFQMVCCLDEREESLRRHVEELVPAAQTFSTAGFFSIPMFYRGAADAHFVPLCPVVIRPQHWVVEEVVADADEVHQRRAKARRALGTATHQIHVGTRTLSGGALLAAAFGALATIPLLARVLFPRYTAQIRRLAGRFLQPPIQTQLCLERTRPSPSAEPGGFGFSLDEMADAVERVLRDTGLAGGLSRLVLIVGHGSSSLNNPHESAHDCGACGGGRGGPNARAVAQMANDPRLRERLQARGITLPDETVFVGALHNTCDDSITYFDLDRLPSSHQADFHAARQSLDLARERDAHERCRRFESAPLSLSFEAALRHVEGRAEDLAQVRPEYGHATNAVCVVGRRSRTRGLYMDRRTFLTSYDPTQDDSDRSILTRILQAVVPVCAGISLEYYFSFVDPVGWGCGTKLPHNVTSLLGVMDGAASDLRPGLPWQMVEIHDPVRLLLVIEATPEAMLMIMERHPGIGRLTKNGWVQMATLSPESAEIHVFRGGGFEPYEPESVELPKAPSSADWYRGWREHLGYAQILAPARDAGNGEA